MRQDEWGTAPLGAIWLAEHEYEILLMIEPFVDFFRLYK